MILLLLFSLAALDTFDQDLCAFSWRGPIQTTVISRECIIRSKTFWCWPFFLLLCLVSLPGFQQNLETNSYGLSTVISHAYVWGVWWPLAKRIEHETLSGSKLLNSKPRSLDQPLRRSVPKKNPLGDRRLYTISYLEVDRSIWYIALEGTGLIRLLDLLIIGIQQIDSMRANYFDNKKIKEHNF